MLCGIIKSIFFVYDFVFKKYDLEEGGLKFNKIGGGQTKLRCIQP